MPVQSRNDFVKSRTRFAEIWAETEWEISIDRPQKARETARAWVGMIELMVMGSINGYAQGGDTPFESPKTAVVPAAPGISLTEMGFSVTYFPAGSPFRFNKDHIKEVRDLFDRLTISRVPGEQYTRETTFPEERVLITWHTQLGPIFHDKKYTTPFNVFLLLPNGAEHETSRVTCRIVAAFPTEEAATQWVKTRADGLKEQHDSNHAKKCRDKACTKRGHINIPCND